MHDASSTVNFKKNLQETSTFTDKIYQHIKELILCGKLKPNQRITVAEFTEYFNVSVTPVREAFQRLMAEKYIAIYKRSNIKVIGLSVEEVKNIFELNRVLDVYGMKQNLKHFSDSQIAELKKKHAKLKEYYEEKRMNQYFTHNMKIHERIWHGYNNEIIYQTLVNANSRISLFIENFAEKYYPPKAIKKTYREHCELMKAIEARDAKLAAEILENHWHVIVYGE
jgi:DNA-binding GntR family transcriptional regulator